MNRTLPAGARHGGGLNNNYERVVSIAGVKED